MRANKHLGDLLKPLFEEIERTVLLTHQQGDVGEEDDITAEILNTMRIVFNGFNAPNITGPSIPGLSIRTKKFRGRGAGAEESIVGADGAIALHIQIGSFSVDKYYLFQAKRFPPTRTFSVQALEQKWKMLICTPDSFFAIYTPLGVDYISAFMVDGGDKPSALPSKSFSDFHADFFNCFIGDHFGGFPPFRSFAYRGAFDDEEIPARDILSIYVSSEIQ